MKNEEMNIEIEEVEVEEFAEEEKTFGTKAKGFWQKHKKKVIGIGAGVGAVLGIGALLLRANRQSDDDSYSCDDDDLEIIDLDAEDNTTE